MAPLSHLLHLPKLAYLEELFADRQVLLIGRELGPLALWLAERCAGVIAVDPVLERVRHWERRYGSTRVEYVHSTLDALDIEDGVCEVVIAIHPPLERGPGSRLLPELQRVLHPEGLLLLAVPTRDPASNSRGWTQDVFQRLLQRHFQGVKVLVQRTGVGVSIGPDGSQASPSLVRPEEPAEVTDLVALCSHLEVQSEEHIYATFPLRPWKQQVFSQLAHRREQLGMLRLALAEAYAFDSGPSASDLSGSPQLPSPPSPETEEARRLSALMTPPVEKPPGKALPPWMLETDLPSADEFLAIRTALELRAGELANELGAQRLTVERLETENADLRLELSESEGALDAAERVRVELLERLEKAQQAHSKLEIEALKLRQLLAQSTRAALRDESQQSAKSPPVTLPSPDVAGEVHALRQQYEQALAVERLKSWSLEERVSLLEGAIRDAGLELDESLAGPELSVYLSGEPDGETVEHRPSDPLSTGSTGTRSIPVPSGDSGEDGWIDVTALASESPASRPREQVGTALIEAIEAALLEELPPVEVVASTAPEPPVSSSTPSSYGLPPHDLTPSGDDTGPTPRDSVTLDSLGAAAEEPVEDSSENLSPAATPVTAGGAESMDADAAGSVRPADGPSPESLDLLTDADADAPEGLPQLRGLGAEPFSDTRFSDGLELSEPEPVPQRARRIEASFAASYEALDQGEPEKPAVETPDRDQDVLPLPIPPADVRHALLDGWDSPPDLGPSSVADSLLTAQASPAIVEPLLPSQAYRGAPAASWQASVPASELPQRGEMALLEALQLKNLSTLPSVTLREVDAGERELLEGSLEDQLKKRFKARSIEAMVGPSTRAPVASSPTPAAISPRSGVPQATPTREVPAAPVASSPTPAAASPRSGVPQATPTREVPAGLTADSDADGAEEVADWSVSTTFLHLTGEQEMAARESAAGGASASSAASPAPSGQAPASSAESAAPSGTSVASGTPVSPANSPVESGSGGFVRRVLSRFKH